MLVYSIVISLMWLSALQTIFDINWKTNASLLVSLGASYGVAIGTLPAGFAPVPIPNGTYVLCVPHRITNGTLIWLIVNTQAIDGVCA